MPVSTQVPRMRVIDSQANDFEIRFNRLLARDSAGHQEVERSVAEIIRRVRVEGDEALLDYTRRFDHFDAQTVESLIVTSKRLHQYLEEISFPVREALEHARDRIVAFHERQKEVSWSYEEPDGSRYGQIVTPLERVGVYVPGGKAAYPSSVLMNVMPARVAGVDQVMMVVPAPSGEVNPTVMAAAAIADVDQVYLIGGAQAIAALAYGTGTIPGVDKIVGPGNIYVATAKRQVFGQVGIDMIAGPSEVVVICDEGANPDWVAMDLFAQAEHDELAQSIVICPGHRFCDRVLASVERLLPEMERREVITVALQRQGAAIVVRNLEEAVMLANRIAPEHLELQVGDPEALLPSIRHAGAVFLGYFSAESLGDYCAGPNHVLPTAGTARFSSPLGVHDFQKRSSLIMCSEAGAHNLGRSAAVLARAEGLTAHARSAEFRAGKIS